MVLGLVRVFISVHHGMLSSLSPEDSADSPQTAPRQPSKPPFTKVLRKLFAGLFKFAEGYFPPRVQFGSLRENGSQQG